MNTHQSTDPASITLADRISGAVWGQFVGDAFCLGSHWIYDLKELRTLFPGGPQGFDEPAAGHYHAGKHPGDLTHYGDAALLLLRSMMERNRFDAADFGARFVGMIECPGYRGYRDHAAKGTVDHYRSFREHHPDAAYSFQDGADDDQPATVSRLAPLSARYFQAGDYLMHVERLTRVCQNNERAVDFVKGHALVLRELFSGKGLEDSFRSSVEQLSDNSEAAAGIGQARALATLPVLEATMQLGQSCPLPSSFPAAMHCALHYEADFAAALRATAAAGGDSAARSAMIGAWLGAAHGIGAIPAAWREKLVARNEIAAGVTWLCSHVSD
jgi:ADP-ribosyl-[dinitrogen reductase] hydrolase